MLNKTFIITMFGEPFDWINQYVDNVQHLGQHGWYWKIFTPNKIESKGNVEIIPMDINQFNDLVEKKLGVKSNPFITPKGVPSVHITDYYVASGVIFEDYLKNADFWGITNLDVVYGRLDHFLPDLFLDLCDVWTDDVNIINGVFCLWRNEEEVNNLFKEIPNWEKKFTQPPCPKCMGEGDMHILYGTDEYDMTGIMKRVSAEGRIRYNYPPYYPIHSHDRMEQHLPKPKLEIKFDGSLFELFRDVNGPRWIHAHPYLGREILFFHFSRTKEWPL